MTFELGARTAWHTHPLGQTLIVISGCGWTRCWGEPKEEIRPGDVIWCRPGKKHWHGAKAYENAVPADSFVRAVAFAMSQPENVDVNESLFRPTYQEL